MVYVASNKRKRALEEAEEQKKLQEETEQRLLNEKRNVFNDVKKEMKSGKITLVTEQHAVVDNEIYCSKAIVKPWPPSVGDQVSTAAVPHPRHEYPRKAIRYRLIKPKKQSRAELNRKNEEATNLDKIRKSYLEAQKVTRHNRKLKETDADKRRNKKHKRGKAPDPKQTWSNADDTSADHNPLYSSSSSSSSSSSRSGSLFGRRSGQVKSSEDDPRNKKKQKVEVHWKNKALEDMTTRDWRIVREDYDINIRGGTAGVNPLRSWSEAGLPDELMRAIERQGYAEPTPIQRQCVPIGVQSRDLIGLAETGSGKTAAFVLPMLLHLLRMYVVVMAVVVVVLMLLCC